MKQRNNGDVSPDIKGDARNSSASVPSSVYADTQTGTAVLPVSGRGQRRNSSPAAARSSMRCRALLLWRLGPVLPKRKLIRYSCGKLTILDGDGLEAAACGCYAVDKETYAQDSELARYRSAVSRAGSETQADEPPWCRLHLPRHQILPLGCSPPRRDSRIARVCQPPQAEGSNARQC